MGYFEILSFGMEFVESQNETSNLWELCALYFKSFLGFEVPICEIVEF